VRVDVVVFVDVLDAVPVALNATPTSRSCLISIEFTKGGGFPTPHDRRNSKKR